MPSALRPNAPAWYPSTSNHDFSPLDQVAPASFPIQPFVAEMPAEAAFATSFALQSSYFGPEHQPFLSQSFAPESPPFTSPSFAPERQPLHLYVHEQPLGYYSNNGFVHTGVRYHYSHMPPAPHNNYPSHLPPTPPNADWQWAVAGADLSAGWAPAAQEMTQWGGEQEKTKKKKKRNKKGKGWRSRRPEEKESGTGEEGNSGA